MQDLSPNELKLIERIRSINDYESMSEYELISPLIASKSVKEIEKFF